MEVSGAGSGLADVRSSGKAPKTNWRRFKSKLTSITGFRRAKHSSSKGDSNSAVGSHDVVGTVSSTSKAHLRDRREESAYDSTSNSNILADTAADSSSSPLPPPLSSPPATGSEGALGVRQGGQFSTRIVDAAPVVGRRRMVQSVGALDDVQMVNTQLERVRAQDSDTVGPNGRRRGTSNPRGFILCRICEAVVPADIMNEHTKQCIRLKRSENEEQGIDSALMSLERSLTDRVATQDGKFSKRLKRKKRCDGLKALVAIVREVRKADWDDVASPGLLRGLLTSTESAKDFVQDDDRMFPVFCERIKERVGKKLELIREIHRRKFEVDQSILKASTIPRANNESGISPSSRSNDNSPQGPGYDNCDKRRSSAVKAAGLEGGQIFIERSNVSSFDRGNSGSKEGYHEFASPNEPSGAVRMIMTPKVIDASGGGVGGGGSGGIGKNRSPHGRIRRGHSVGADDYDPATMAILSKFKRSPPRKVSMTDFQVLKPISKGAFGKVYLCRRHKFPDDLYAVKVLPKAEVKNKTDLMQVTKERRIMAKLHSPFVVDLMFSFQSERNLFLVMEFLPGGDLFSLLQNLGALAEDPARFYIAEILHATNYLHDHGILHRDLKPDNVLIGKDGHIKLTDFGLSERGMLQRKKEIMKPSFRGVSGSVRSFAEVVVGASAKAWDAVGGIFSGIVKGGGKGHSATSESGPGKTSESETERANVMGRDVVGRDSPDGGLPDKDTDPALMTMRLAPALVRGTSGESYYSNSSDTSSQGRSKKSTNMMGGRPPSLIVTRARSSMSMINYERATSLQAPSMKSGSLHFHRSRSRSNYASQGRQLSAGTHRALQLDDIPEIEGGGHGGDGGATRDGCRDPSKESRRSSAFNRDSGDFPPLRAKSAESDSSGGEMQRMSSGSFEGNSTSLVSTTRNSGIPILSSSCLPDDFESEREQTQWSSSERRQGGRLRDSIHTLPSDDSVASAAQLKEWQHGNTDATAGGTPDYLAPELLSKDMTHGPPVDLWAIGVILYEFLLGIPPFNAPTAHEIFNNIRNRDIYWPEDEEEAGAAAAAVVEENGNEDDEEETLISPQARDLIDKLLNMDPSKRPTAKQTMKHPFFAGLDFETLRTNQEPPFIPDLEDEFDTSYFDSRQLQDLSLFLDEEEDGTGHEMRGMEQLGRVSALNSPALAPAEDPAGEAQELNNLILSRASTPLKSHSQGSANSGSKEKGCSSPEELERPPPSLMLGSFLSPGFVSELQQSQSARSIMRRSDGSVNQGTMSLTNSPTVLSPDARKSIGMGKPRLHAKRASKTTDDIYIYRKESAPELERLLRVEKLRGDSQRSSLDGMRARKLTGGSVPGTPQSFAGKVQIAAPNGLPSLDLNNELIRGLESPRISSRSSSPMPSQTGMAARKFLARPTSSSSVDIDFDDDAGTIGTGAQSRSSSASVDQRPTQSGSVIESKEDYDLSSFSFENLNRLSEMNMEAAARAQDLGKTRNNM